MVTYLACFIVCDFEHKFTNTKEHNTLFRVYATPTQSQRVSYALDIGANITDYFENYFDVSYIVYNLHYQKLSLFLKRLYKFTNTSNIVKLNTFR